MRVEQVDWSQSKVFLVYFIFTCYGVRPFISFRRISIRRIPNRHQGFLGLGLGLGVGVGVGSRRFEIRRINCQNGKERTD